MSKKKIETIHEIYQNAPIDFYDILLQFRDEFEITQFEFNGKTVEYIIAGKGKKTLLMFHGALGSADTSYNEILRLKGRYRIIVPTIRDIGSLDDISDAINEILQRENVEHLYVRGGSFGAYIAQAYFKRNYEKIDRLILINGIPPKNEYTKKDQRYVRLFKLIFKIIPETLAKKFMLKELKKLENQNHELSKEQQNELNFLMMQMNERLAKVRKRHILESLMLVVEFDLNESMKSDDFSDWTGKVFLITDTKDSSFKYFEELKAQFPNPQVKIFDGAGHILQIVYKSEFERVHDIFFAE